MFRSFALLALLFLSCAARAEDVMSADVGGAAVRFPIPEGYVRGSQAAPAVFEMIKAAIPPEARLVETLLSLGLDPAMPAMKVPASFHFFIASSQV